MKNTVTVIKRNIHGQETWRYEGRIIDQEPHKRVIEAFFDQEQVLVGRLILRRGDRFVETYYDNRWLNIFEIYDRADGSLKGYYCNICTPAEFEVSTISFKDLALDLVVYPDGEQAVLDEDEYLALPISEADRRRAEQALAELSAMFRDQRVRNTG